MSEPSVHDLVDPDLTGIHPVSQDGSYPAVIEVPGPEWVVEYVPVQVSRREKGWTRQETRRS